MISTREDIFAEVARRSLALNKTNSFPANCDENINTDNTNNTSNTDNANNTNAMPLSLTDKTIANTSASQACWQEDRDTGSQNIMESTLKGEGVSVIAETKKSLVQEKQDLIDANEWVSQHQVDYVKLSVFYSPSENSSDVPNLKCMYNLKLTGVDLKKHKYSSKVTHRHNDYLSYAKGKWEDADTWIYAQVAESVKQNWKAGGFAYAGRCAKNTGMRKSKNRMPIIAYTTVHIEYDFNEDEYVCHLYHNDFYKRMSIPAFEWKNAMENANSSYDPRDRNAKPMISFEWRNLA